MECRNLVGGEWVHARCGGTSGVCDPATGIEFARVPCGGTNDALSALNAAHGALDLWRSQSVQVRSALLVRVADSLRQRSHELAQIITSENGKPIEEALGEVHYSADFFTSAAHEALRLASETIASNQPLRIRQALPEPVGVVAAMTPWNFPLAMLARKCAPALAAGCTLVAKPSDLTPLSALALGETLVQCGLPHGVVNIITGTPGVIAETWLRDGRVRALSFTGSTAVGRRLIELSAQQLVRLSLELGGHAPLIVLEDAEIESAVEGAVAGKFRATGQTCISPNRFFVADRVYDEFVERFARASSELPVGRGVTPGVRIGPLISDAAVHKVRLHVDDARARGGRILTGGSTVPVSGCLDRFFAPTVIADATCEMLCCREETFGPVAPIVRVHDEMEAVTQANASPFGLAGYVFSADPMRIERMARQLNCGIVGVNTTVVSDASAPFGGRGWSGYGREGGRWGVEEFISWKYTCTATPS